MGINHRRGVLTHAPVSGAPIHGATRPDTTKRGNLPPLKIRDLRQAVGHRVDLRKIDSRLRGNDKKITGMAKGNRE